MPTILGNAARAEKDIFGNTDIGTMTVGNGDHDENYDHGPNGDHDDRVDPDVQPSENNIAFPLHRVSQPVTTKKDKCTNMKENIETNMKQERKREIHVPTNLRQLKERSGSRYQ